MNIPTMSTLLFYIAYLSGFMLFIGCLSKPLGYYIYQIFEKDPLPQNNHFLGKVELFLLKRCGIQSPNQQSWQHYGRDVLLFSFWGCVVTYLLLRHQSLLPFNPQHLADVDPLLAFNTAVSFVSNTDWQAYSGESTMSYFSQMVALGWHNFTSPAVGLCVALVLARGLTKYSNEPEAASLGNFAVDFLRCLLYLLLPLSILGALLMVFLGTIQNTAPYLTFQTLEGITQTLPMGPVASQEIIKQLGTNGGGFFNANSAHPFENPSAFSNFLQIIFIFAIPAALTHTYGLMAQNTRQGWVIFAAMSILFLCNTLLLQAALLQSYPSWQGMSSLEATPFLEGIESRFQGMASALFASATTSASCGAVNAMHDSLTPLAGLMALLNILLGEVIFGGVGAGLYGMLMFVLLAVFIAGLMVGRTPEYLGKKIAPKVIQLVMLYILIFPLVILLGTSWSTLRSDVLAALSNQGPHGLTEIFYAYSSAAGNNGSAFGGLNSNIPWLNITLGLSMLAGRFLMIVPIFAIAGCMLKQKIIPPSLGTFPTDDSLFTGLLIFVVIILGALTFLPALTLGPLLEHFTFLHGKLNA